MNRQKHGYKLQHFCGRPKMPYELRDPSLFKKGCLIEAVNRKLHCFMNENRHMIGLGTRKN